MNYTMLTDFYELTMANGYFREGMGDKIAYFDMFFRFPTVQALPLWQGLNSLSNI